MTPDLAIRALDAAHEEQRKQLSEHYKTQVGSIVRHALCGALTAEPERFETIKARLAASGLTERSGSFREVLKGLVAEGFAEQVENQQAGKGKAPLLYRRATAQ